MLLMLGHVVSDGPMLLMLGLMLGLVGAMCWLFWVLLCFGWSYVLGVALWGEALYLPHPFSGCMPALMEHASFIGRAGPQNADKSWVVLGPCMLMGGLQPPTPPIFMREPCPLKLPTHPIPHHPPKMWSGPCGGS